MPTLLQVLILDDSVLYRDQLAAALTDVPDISVCGVAPTAAIGLEKARRLNPDVVVLAPTLPDLGPADVVRALAKEIPACGAIVASATTPLEVDRAILALEAGAFDFVLKPDRRTRGDAVASLRRLLLPKIRCFSIRRYSQAAKAGTQPGPASAAVSVRPEDLLPRTARRLAAGRLPAIEVVVVGASTGGPEALSKLIPALPRDFPLPVLTVLHMPKLFTARMAAALAKESAIPVSEACDGETAAAGHAYLAAGGMHLKVERGTRRRTVLRLTDDPPENGCKPAVDVLFRSAAAAFGERVLAVLLTGMGEDGTRGLAELKRLRAPAIVQDEATSVIWGMPGSAVKAGLADEVLPLARIAPRIVELITRNLVPE